MVKTLSIVFVSSVIVYRNMMPLHLRVKQFGNVMNVGTFRTFGIPHYHNGTFCFTVKEHCISSIPQELHIIKPTEIHASRDDIRLRR